MTHSQFLELLPERPYAADIARFQRVFSKENAITKRLVQINHPMIVNWVSFDLDEDDSYFVPEERGCPEPHFISVNRENGHAHAAYLVNSVTMWGGRTPVVRLLEDVKHGLSKRMGSDPNFSGHLTKNPFNKHWETHWQAVAPYDLSRLADCLDRNDKKRSRGVTIGVGRNCSIFDRLRRDAYREVLPFKRTGRSEEDFCEVMFSDALRMNRRFASPLCQQEVKGIAKSVSKWVWDRFSDAEFSKIQSQRRRKGIVGPTLKEAKPWEAEGISESTFFRRKRASKANTLIWSTVTTNKQRDYTIIRTQE